MVLADAIERWELVARVMCVRAPVRKTAPGEREVDAHVDHPVVDVAIHRFEEVTRVGVFAFPAWRQHAPETWPRPDDDAVAFGAAADRG